MKLPIYSIILYINLALAAFDNCRPILIQAGDDCPINDEAHQSAGRCGPASDKLGPTTGVLGSVVLTKDHIGHGLVQNRDTVYRAFGIKVIDSKDAEVSYNFLLKPGEICRFDVDEQWKTLESVLSTDHKTYWYWEGDGACWGETCEVPAPA